MFPKITPERRVAQILCSEIYGVRGIGDDYDFLEIINRFEAKLKELKHFKYVSIDEDINDDQAMV